MEKCQYCGAEYIKSKSWELLPESLKAKIPDSIPSCDCLFEIADKEAEQRRIDSIRENMIKAVSKYKEISVSDKKFFDSRFENSDLEEKHMMLAKRYADAFVIKENNIGLILHGGVGNGKTHAVACIANQLMDHKKTVLTLSLSGYLNKLRGEWEKAEKDILSKVKKVDVLIIDDFGVEKVTEWVLEKIFNVIDARYRADKALLVTTNLSLEDIEVKFDSRISDRIKEMCFQHHVDAPSRRGKNTVKKMKDFLRVG